MVFWVFSSTRVEVKVSMCSFLTIVNLKYTGYMIGLMFINFNVTGIHDRHPATVLPNRRKEKPAGDEKSGQEGKRATA